MLPREEKRIVLVVVDRVAGQVEVSVETKGFWVVDWAGGVSAHQRIHTGGPGGENELLKYRSPGKCQ